MNAGVPPSIVGLDYKNNYYYQAEHQQHNYLSEERASLSVMDELTFLKHLSSPQNTCMNMDDRSHELTRAQIANYV